MYSLISCWQFIEYGVEGSVLVLQTCLEQLHFNRTDLKGMQLEPVFVSILKFLLDKPNFSTVFCQSLRSLEINDEFLENLSNVLQLSLSEKISIGLALSDSEIVESRMSGEYLFFNSIYCSLQFIIH